MVYDNLKNIDKYTQSNDLIAEAMKVIKTLDLEALEVGKYIVDEDKLYYMIQQYDSHTWENGKFETHDNHIDINGEETITYADRKEMTEKAPYNEVKDVTFYDDSVRGEDFILRNGDFMILEPNDGHKPGNCLTAPSPVKKLVFKVLC